MWQCILLENFASCVAIPASRLAFFRDLFELFGSASTTLQHVGLIA